MNYRSNCTVYVPSTCVQGILFDAIGHDRLFYVHKISVPTAHSAIM